MSLKGKVAIVTGSGIGRACSLRLAEDGASVAVWAINGSAAGETVSQITKAGGQAIARESVGGGRYLQ
jgi:NAD(P)-dependent dehydrogenase (short-subunit alcohol dehydrogenase family)